MLLEVGCVAPRVALSVLGKEDAVGVVSPSWTSTPDVVRSEPHRKTALSHGAPHILDEPAHAVDRTPVLLLPSDFALHALLMVPNSGRLLRPDRQLGTESPSNICDAFVAQVWS